MRSYISLVEQLLLEKFDPDEFVARIRSTIELMHRGATEGEQSAAKAALDRLTARARQEIAQMRDPDSGVTHAEIDRFMRALQQLGALEPTASPIATPARPPLNDVIEVLDIANRGNEVYGIVERGGYPDGQTYIFSGQLHGPLRLHLCNNEDEAQAIFDAQLSHGFKAMPYGGHLPDGKGQYVRVSDWVIATLRPQLAKS